MSDLMCCIENAGDSTCIAFLKGMADMASHEQFQKAMSEVEAHDAKFVVLDIRQLGFITSLGVGEMLRLFKSKRNSGGNVVIAGANQYVEGVFKAARLGSVMSIVPTVDAGLAAFVKA